VSAATAPSDLKAGAAQRGGLKASDKIEHPGDLLRLLADAYNRQVDSVLTAALPDVTVGAATTGIYARASQPQWLSELWSGRAHQGTYVPLAGSGSHRNEGCEVAVGYPTAGRGLHREQGCGAVQHCVGGKCGRRRPADCRWLGPGSFSSTPNQSGMNE
jgi:hypothetical protein